MHVKSKHTNENTAAFGPVHLYYSDVSVFSTSLFNLSSINHHFYNIMGTYWNYLTPVPIRPCVVKIKLMAHYSPRVQQETLPL